MDKQIENKNYWDNLIIDHLMQSISESDRVKLTAWVSESDEHRRYLYQMEELWNSSGITDERFPFDHEKAYALFERRIKRSSLPVSVRAPKTGYLRKKIAALAAVLIPFIFLGYYTFLYFDSEQSRSALQLAEITSPKGSKTQLRLPDGTSVCLNSGSVIRYGEGFGTKNRMLELSGDAYLTVRHDGQLPFIVQAGDIEVKVLGTEFNIDAYPDNEEIKVALFKGSVSMSDTKRNNSVVLKPMETGVFRLASGQLNVVADSTGNSLNWMYDRLVFKGETFKEIARLLERRFDVEIRIHRAALLEKRFGGDFAGDETLEQIFKVMAVSGKFSYEIKEKTIDIY